MSFVKVKLLDPANLLDVHAYVDPISVDAVVPMENGSMVVVGTTQILVGESAMTIVNRLEQAKEDES